MKKLTEDWKVKKSYLINKSFCESIDCDLSNISESKTSRRNSQFNSMRKKQSVGKSPLSALNIPVMAVKENASTSIRRSNRLRDKSLSTKVVDKRINSCNKDVSFSFSESFGLEMANEASKFEKGNLCENTVLSNSLSRKNESKLGQNIGKLVAKQQELVDISCSRNVNGIKCIKVKEDSLFPLCNNMKGSHKAETSIDELKQEQISDTSSKKICLNGSKENCNDSKEIRAETIHENQNSVASADSKSSSVLEEDCLDLAYWGLPSQVINAYRSRNINKMFQWQYECLSMKNVLNGKNLVYSAPTSAGKTLVAEILMLKKVIESKKKAMFILPFVSVVREKVNYFQEMFQDTGVVVGGYMGAHRPPGGFKAIDIAICTIEKANNLINKLMEEKRLDELGILVVDELHMLGDNSRGYLLELLLTKLLYNCKRSEIDIQIIGMSATLPNLNVLSFWLNAELYHTDFRPVPLHEMYKVGPVIYDSKTSKHIRELGKDSITFANDSDHSVYLAIETVASGNGVLIFCPSKNWCEALATNIAREVYNTGRTVEHKNPAYNFVSQKLREYINGSLLSDILLQLKSSPAGIDPVLKLTVPFGVAFHHAGLTFEERDIIEGAFKQGILKVLVATSTLSSGVNLPARRVIIRSPLFCGSIIDTLSYKQMVGRAGRKGIDDQGESILLCKESERKSALQLVTSELQAVKSCLLKSGKDGLHSSLKRAVIEVIASGVAVTHEEVIQYASCTLLFASMVHANSNEEQSDDVEASLNKCLDYLLDNDFIFKTEKKDNDKTCVSYKPTQLGAAILASGFSPEDSLRVLKELQLARRCFVLENDLHILYEVTPPYLSDQMGSINWMNFLSLWEQLPEDYRRVGELVGVRESFIGLGIQGKLKMNSAQAQHKLAVHQRFYATLALNDLIQEVPLAVVSEKYNCNKGILQSLQQTTSTFSGMLTIFCNKLGWYNLEMLFSQFQKRVHFGIQQELCDLIQLSTLNAQRARVLYNAGYETISSLASADCSELELVLYNAGAFESEKQLDGDIAEEAMKRREVKRIRITGKRGVNEKEAALLIIKEAQNFIKHELGIKAITWESSEEKDLPALNKNSEEEKRSSILITPRTTKKSHPVLNTSTVEVNRSSSGDKEANRGTELNISTEKENFTISAQNRGFKSSHVESLDTKEISVRKNSKRSLSNNSNHKGRRRKTSGTHSKSPDLNSDGAQKNIKSESLEKSNFAVECSQNKVPLGLKRVDTLTYATNHLSNTPCDKNISGEIRVVNNSSHMASSIPSVQQDVILNVNCNVGANNNNLKLNNSDDKSKMSSSEILHNVSDKNESYFCAEDVNGLFDKLEKTVLDIKNEKIHENIETPCPKNDLSFSQILLSQSAEIDDVYLAQSFMNSDCLDKNPHDNKPQLTLSTSKIEKIHTNFISKDTVDALDAIFDSPVHGNDISVKKSTPVASQKGETLHDDCPMQLSDIDAIFDSPMSSSVTIIKKSKLLSNKPIDPSQLQNIDNKHLKRAKEKENMNSKYSGDVMNLKNVCFSNPKIDKLAYQSTPKDDLNKAQCLEDLNFSIEVSSCSLLENCNLDFPESNFPEKNVKSSSICKSDPPANVRKSENSGDLFESEGSLDADMFNNIDVEKIAADKIETHFNAVNNVQSLSSCSDEIFAFEKSFEKMLENPSKEKNDIPVLNEKNIHTLDTKICKNEENKESSDCKIPVSVDQDLSPNTVKEFCLGNSGDLFEDSVESIHEALNNDPRKKLSFGFEDNAELFQTWNPSPNKDLHSESVNNDEVVLPKEDNLNNAVSDSFLANVSHFSSFLSNCSEGTPSKCKQTHSPQTVHAPTLVSGQQNLSMKDKTKSGIFQDANASKAKVNGLSSSDLSLKNSSFGEIGFNVVDVTDENFDKFLKLLEEVSDFGLSVACEKAEQKNAVNIGPPKLRAKKSSTPAEKLLVDDDVLIAGLSFCWSKKVFFVSFPTDSNNGTNDKHLTNLDTKLKSLQQLFHNFTRKRIIAYDIKSYYKTLQRGCNIVFSQNKNVSYVDTSIAAWLLDPSDGQQTLQQLVLNYWPDASHLIEGFDRGHGSLGLQYWSSVNGRKRSSTEAYVSFHLIEILSSHLKDKKLFQSFVDVEMPSILTLAKMEQNGLGFDLALAMNFRKELQIKQDTLLKKAYQLAGHSFNIMSSKDLSRILYKELKLNPLDVDCSQMATKHLSLGVATRSSAKKLPPELKTNKECLEKIMHLHPLPKTIMDWRKLAFAISQVLMPFLRENRFDEEFQMHRLHSTCYVYTVTGRINMHTPNLQFVPRNFGIEDGTSNSEESGKDEYYQIDDEISLYGISLRNMFVPSKGNVLLSADYSQLELRILAHLSGDVKLLKSLNSGEDIFKQIAAVWKNMNISAVTDEIRQQAKKICYGIIYGMSSKTLSHQLRTTENDAAYFMESFKRSYPGMTHYLDSVLKNCRAKGYVTTILERRRYLPHILSSNKGERSHAERQAINTTVQGSAADVIKKAMIEIEKQLNEIFDKNKGHSTAPQKGVKKIRKCCRGGFLVLQLHDELIYEVNERDLEIVKNIVKTVMEGTTKLSVILPVNIKVGPSWGSMNKVL